MDGQTFCVILDHRMITDPFWKKVSPQEELTAKKGIQACFLTAVDPMNIPMLTPRFIENEPRTILYEKN